MPLLERLAAYVAGAPRPLWLVGGCVRDRLAGRPTRDIDLICPGAVDFARRFARSARAAFVLLDDGRGTARVVARDDPDAALDFCEPHGTLDEDLHHRDFTVNAIACDLAQWWSATPAWLDPTGGQADLAAGRLRACGPTSLLDDPLRVLRGHRLAAGYGLRADEATWQLMRAALPGLAGVAAERRRAEWLLWLGLSAAGDELARAAELGTLAQLGLEAGEQAAARVRRADVALELLASLPLVSTWLEAVPHRALCRWAALLPDLSAPPAPAELGAAWALSRRERHLLATAREEPPRGRPALAAALAEHGLDVVAAVAGAVGREALSLCALRTVTAHLADGLLARWAEPPLVTGKDLLGTMGYTAGPTLGAALAHLRRAQIAGELTARAAALAWAEEWLQHHG